MSDLTLYVVFFQNTSLNDKELNNLVIMLHDLKAHSIHVLYKTKVK